MLVETGAAALIGQGAKLVAKLFGDKKDARRMRQLAARYWASILFEIAGNISDLKSGLKTEDLGLPLRFSNYDALTKEVSQIDPAPIALTRVGRLVAQLRMIDRLYAIRTEFSATPKNYSVSGPSLSWQDKARQHLDGLIREYGSLRNSHLVAAREAYDDDDDWQTQEPELTPPAITA